MEYLTRRCFHPDQIAHGIVAVSHLFGIATDGDMILFLSKMLLPAQTVVLDVPDADGVILQNENARFAIVTESQIVYRAGQMDGSGDLALFQIEELQIAGGFLLVP